MAALVQTIPQQSGTVPVLQTRPSSSSGSFSAPQSLQPQTSRNMSWNSFNTTGAYGGYRGGHPVVAPYAFTSTPNLAVNPQNRQPWSPHLRTEHRTSSAPSVPQGTPHLAHAGIPSRFVNHPAAGSVSSSSNSSVNSYRSKDDTAIPSRQLRRDHPPLRPLSTATLASPSFMTPSSPASRPSPDRYRRGNRRAENVPGGQSSTFTPTVTVDDHSTPPAPKGYVPDRPHSRGHARVSSADETSRLERQSPELAKRYRRRSWGTMDNANLINMQLHLPMSPVPSSAGPRDYFDQGPRPRSAHSQRDVSGGSHSPHSSTSSVGVRSVGTGLGTNAARQVRETGTTDSTASSTAGNSKTDDSRRMSKPSPLSKPVTMDTPSSPRNAKENTSPAQPETPASRRLAELTRNDPRKPGKSRLRRAFSFGSASELLKASAQTNASKKEAIAAERARREMLKEQLGPEQAAIAEQQEASGLGESIYSHQGIFGSTDDLSVSSTASSASVMLRKMGKGVKRSTRSLVGLFRPKSVASIRSTDGINVEPTAPQVSMVNIEAERESVTVNADPQDLPRGGTVFPKVERNNAEDGTPGSHEGNASDDPQSRKSIVGGDRERAEILAAVRKGILKSTWPGHLAS